MKVLKLGSATILLALSINLMVSCGNSDQKPDSMNTEEQQPVARSEEENESNNPVNSDVSPYKWLIGAYIMNESNPEQTLYETWRLSDDQKGLTGENYRMETGAKMVLENIRFYHQDGNWYYSPTVIGQNNGDEISFKLISTSPDSLVFENKEHDFPTRISYIKTNEGIQAYIDGLQNGMNKRISFPMRRLEE